MQLCLSQRGEKCLKPKYTEPFHLFIVISAFLNVYKLLPNTQNFSLKDSD